MTPPGAPRALYCIVAVRFPAASAGHDLPDPGYIRRLRIVRPLSRLARQGWRFVTFLPPDPQRDPLAIPDDPAEWTQRAYALMERLDVPLDALPDTLSDEALDDALGAVLENLPTAPPADPAP